MRGYVPRIRDPARARKPAATIPSDEIENGSEISSRSRGPGGKTKGTRERIHALAASPRARIFLVHVAEREAHLAPSLFRRIGSSSTTSLKNDTAAMLFERRRRLPPRRRAAYWTKLEKLSRSYQEDNATTRTTVSRTGIEHARLSPAGVFAVFLGAVHIAVQ